VYCRLSVAISRFDIKWWLLQYRSMRSGGVAVCERSLCFCWTVMALSLLLMFSCLQTLVSVYAQYLRTSGKLEMLAGLYKLLGRYKDYAVLRAKSAFAVKYVMRPTRRVHTSTHTLLSL
jgi:hypothetical protein